MNTILLLNTLAALAGAIGAGAHLVATRRRDRAEPAVGLLDATTNER